MTSIHHLKAPDHKSSFHISMGDDLGTAGGVSNVRSPSQTNKNLGGLAGCNGLSSLTSIPLLVSFSLTGCSTCQALCKKRK